MACNPLNQKLAVKKSTNFLWEFAKLEEFASPLHWRFSDEGFGGAWCFFKWENPWDVRHVTF